MEQIIYKDASLKYIIDSITSGLIGVSDEENIDIDNLLIISDNYNNVFIKPMELDISKEILNFIGTNQQNIDSVDNILRMFVVFTPTIEDNENNQKEKILYNVSLSEYLLMQNNIEEFLNNKCWKLLNIS